MCALSGMAVTLFLGGWQAPLPFPRVHPLLRLVRRQAPRPPARLHLDPRHAAAPADRPADPPGLEIPGAARPHQPRHRRLLVAERRLAGPAPAVRAGPSPSLVAGPLRPPRPAADRGPGPRTYRYARMNDRAPHPHRPRDSSAAAATAMSLRNLIHSVLLLIGSWLGIAAVLPLGRRRVRGLRAGPRLRGRGLDGRPFRRSADPPLEDRCRPAARLARPRVLGRARRGAVAGVLAYGPSLRPRCRPARRRGRP
jgi:hypothetical protein